MMMIIKNLPLFIFLVLIFLQTCFCMNNHICSPSSCGNIGNISFPFRLKNDPIHCGDPDFELECENNVTTVLYINPLKYRVKEINYFNSSIWLIDVSVINNSCSFPNVSLTSNYFFINSPYSYEGATIISLMSCPYELKNSSLFLTELPADYCDTSNSNYNSSTHTYINFGGVMATAVGENCTVGPTALTWWKFKDVKNVSVSEIHNSLLYGFQLYWYMGSKCRWCNGRYLCHTEGEEEISCRHSMVAMVEALWDHIKHPYYRYYSDNQNPIDSNGVYDPFFRPNDPSSAVILILLLVIVVVFAGVSIPAMIILGFTSASAFIFIQMNQDRKYLNTNWPVEHLPLIIGLFFAVRFIIVFPCIAWFFIYKFRRRHLSRFAVIEDFLKSENNLMPIRYSYSEIKKITRGFREKLGQGGYGTVYKGKLRSGYDVAVKILGKSGGNGQDFMNEISTIGRIHHVNVVKLVGYCAERSKRALVFDYMHNGSLDKYLYSGEKTSCLSWERKYEIAIGVARGIGYLHRGCDIQILHFDIKPHNILLDDNFTPKITDFGLAKFFSTDKKVVTMTAIRGTVGYVAPELINRGFGEVSYKADVYSFGMLLIEMVGLNKDLKRNNQASSQYFPDWIYDSFEQGHEIEIGVTDENNDDDNNNDADREIAKKMTIVALWCIQMSPGDRPSMNKVVQMLEAQSEHLQVPNRQFGAARVAINDEDQSWSTYSIGSTSLIPNDAAPSIEMTVVD